jgi:hypothetical protein
MLNFTPIYPKNQGIINKVKIKTPPGGRGGI